MAQVINKPTNKKFKNAELRKLDYSELQKKLAESKEKLMRCRFEHATSTLENTAMLKTLRQEIARIETIMAQLKPSKNTLKHDVKAETSK